MIANRDLMIDAIKRLEQEFNKQGWDREPVLSVMYSYARRIGGDDINATAVIPFPVQPHELTADEVGAGLMYLGGVIRAGDGPQFLTEHGQRPTAFTGAVFVSEGWENNIPVDERGGRKLADIPGSREVRVAFAIDTAGRTYNVCRVRGERPTIQVVEKGIDQDGQETKLVGQVIIGLRDLVYGLGRQLPFGSVDLDAIAAVGAQEELEDSP